MEEERTTVVLIISSSPAVTPLGSCTPRVCEGERSGGPLHGTLPDATTMYTWFLGHGAHIFDMLSGLGPRTTASTLDRIQNFFDADITSSGRVVTDLVIYYTGHGQRGTGNWCFSDGCVRLEEILSRFDACCNSGFTCGVCANHSEGQRYRCGACGYDVCETCFTESRVSDTHTLEHTVKRIPAKRLAIIADCCFSGVWVNKLRERDPGCDGAIAMQAACGAHEWARDTARGGIFTRAYALGERSSVLFSPTAHVPTSSVPIKYSVISPWDFLCWRMVLKARAITDENRYMVIWHEQVRWKEERLRSARETQNFYDGIPKCYAKAVVDLLTGRADRVHGDKARGWPDKVVARAAQLRLS